jgi:hypothetical protein
MYYAYVGNDPINGTDPSGTIAIIAPLPNVTSSEARVFRFHA